MSDHNNKDKTRIKSLSSDQKPDDEESLLRKEKQAPQPDDRTRMKSAAPPTRSAVPDDKTRIATPKKPPTPSGAHQEEIRDKTRIVIPPRPTVRKDAVPGGDNTRISPKATDKLPPSSAAPGSRVGVDGQEGGMKGEGDRTRVLVKKHQPIGRTAEQVEDKTRMQANRRPAPPSGTPDSNKTQFKPAKKPAQTSTPDATRITIPPVLPSADGKVVTPGAVEYSHGILKNRFVFEEVLGAGGMGVVYKAKDLLKVEAQDRDPYVAIKVLGDEFKEHPEAFIALQRESRKTQRIAHPNIVNVYDFDRDGDSVFMTMEYLDGKPLDKLISQYRSTGLAPDDAMKILEGISAAMIYAHEQEIIHSDFKPGNIFVLHNGTAKVFDFGIARAVAKAESFEESVGDKTVFDAGNLGALTPAYASLEMLEGKTPDIRDDVYALGCVAYELFTGDHPYDRVHADEAYRQKLKPKRIPSLKGNQWKAIEGALALKREDRLASVDEFWRLFTRRQSHSAKIALAVILVVAAAGATAYRFMPEPVVDDGVDFRSEIEQQLRLEFRMQTVADLLDSPAFTDSWEALLWQEIEILREVLGTDHEWILDTEAAIYALYIEYIGSQLDAGVLERIANLIQNASRYGTAHDELADLQARLDAAIAARDRLEQERLRQQQLAQQQRQQQIAVAEQEQTRTNEFERAVANVEQQLNCRNHINMGDFEIALDKLKSISMPRYRSQEPRIITQLVECIERIGENFPERAQVAKDEAIKLFGNNASIRGIRIVARDSCGLSLAGLGASGMRATCRDNLSGGGRGPIMVVIPAAGNIKAFAMGKFELSVDELNEFCSQSSACSVSSAGGELPATNISRSTAQAYLSWLSERTGRTYRLPTLAEWQHAARAGSNAADPNRNCRLRSRGISRGDGFMRVSIGQQNAWGLVNHYGNAREWVIGAGGSLLAAGGSYETPVEECNAENTASHSGSADGLTGFRIVREIVQ